MLEIKSISYPGGVSDVSFIDQADLFRQSPDLIVADEHTAVLYSFPEDWQRRMVLLPSGEESKNWSSIEKILHKAVDLGLDRKSLMLGIGGGVITDMTAFAASLYMRGCRVALLPTTLLAMVDAAVGGKTGVDFMGYKNMVGTFNPAESVWIDPQVLGTLPEREYRSGMAEAIKTAILGDRNLLEILEKGENELKERNPELLREVISRCIQVKGRIVEEDLKEKGIRTWLNLGHTFGHALETASGFSLVSHGEGVAWGIGRALSAGLKLQKTPEELAHRILALLKSWNYPLRLKAESAAVQKAMFQDKKKQGGEVRFVLVEEIEKLWVGPVDSALIEEVLKEGLE